MATYYPVSLDEMRSFLQSSKGWTEEQQHQEKVFIYKLKDNPFIQIRVFSGISVVTGESRKCGGDAIRVAAVNTNTHVGWIKTRRVHRVLGWQKNLKERILKVVEQSKARLRK